MYIIYIYIGPSIDGSECMAMSNNCNDDVSTRERGVEDGGACNNLSLSGREQRCKSWREEGRRSSKSQRFQLCLVSVSKQKLLRLCMLRRLFNALGIQKILRRRCMTHVLARYGD